jgi:hypothetical protein
MGIWSPGGFQSGFSKPPSIPSNLFSGYVADFDSRYGVALDGSNNVSDWAERYGNGMVFSQSDPAKRPALSNNFFGTAPGVSFTGTSSHSLTGNVTARNLFRNLSGVTIYSIHRVDSTTGNAYFIHSWTNNNSATRFVYGCNNGGPGYFISHRLGDTGSANIQNGLRGWSSFTQTAVFQADFANAVTNIFSRNALSGSAASALAPGTIPNTAAGQITMGSQGGTTAFLTGTLIRQVICSGVHTAAQRSAYWNSLKSEYDTSAPMRFCSSSMNTIVQFHGDSITAGSGILPVGTPALPDRVFESLGSNPSKQVLNFGLGSATIVSLSGERSTYIDILPVNTATNMVYVIFAGTNDISGGATDVTAYANLKTWFQAAIAARPGLKVVICTPIARGNVGFTGTQKGYLESYRNLINTNAVADGAAAVADLGGLPQFLCTAASTVYTNTNYYKTDLIHPVDGGNLVLAPAIVTAINSILS